MKSYWDCLAHQFQHQQPPLRPCAEDAGILREIVGGWHRRHLAEQTRVLLLGVTPEIAGFNWPAGTSLIAIEKSQAMIERIWPGDIPGRRRVMQGNWFEMELEPGSFDFVVGDGFSTAWSYPDQYQKMAGVISKCLKPEGLLVARLFVRTNKKETYEGIVGDLKARRISRFDILKWRLGMALQESVAGGVVVEEIYRAWNRLEAEWPSLVEDAGWPRATVDTIKLYDGRSDRYAFPTAEEISEAFSEHLAAISLTIPSYEFGQCCPTLVYRRRTDRH